MPYPSIVDAEGDILATIPGVPPSSLPSTVILDRRGTHRGPRHRGDGRAGAGHPDRRDHGRGAAAGRPEVIGRWGCVRVRLGGACPVGTGRPRGTSMDVMSITSDARTDRGRPAAGGEADRAVRPSVACRVRGRSRVLTTDLLAVGGFVTAVTLGLWWQHGGLTAAPRRRHRDALGDRPALRTDRRAGRPRRPRPHVAPARHRAALRPGPAARRAPLVRHRHGRRGRRPRRDGHLGLGRGDGRHHRQRPGRPARQRGLDGGRHGRAPC